MLLAKAEWGTVPDWVTAFGTLAAFAVALRLLAKELAARREVQEDRRRAQARLVSAWHTSKWPAEIDLGGHVTVSTPPWPSVGEPVRCVMVKNGSEEPVYAVHATVVHFESPVAEDPEAAFWKSLESEEASEAWEGELVYLSWSMLPPLETKGAVLPNSLFPNWHLVIGLSFTDSQGRRFHRFPDGRLIEATKQQRRSRKDYMNAWIAGELEDLDY